MSILAETHTEHRPSGTATLLVFGAVFLILGLVGVTNFRGFSEFHSRASIRLASPLRRVPPWRWIGVADDKDLVTRAVWWGRVVGVIFVAGGVAMLVSGVASI